MSSEYIPGVCNIGRSEIRLRKLGGWIGLIATLGVWFAFVAQDVDRRWRLLLFIPAMLSAIGFLQAWWHFCAKFGLGGVFNFGANVGKTDTVEQAEYRRQDRITALKIIGLSAMVGVIVAVVAYVMPVQGL
jgi:hypothetical protein